VAILRRLMPRSQIAWLVVASLAVALAAARLLSETDPAVRRSGAVVTSASGAAPVVAGRPAASAAARELTRSLQGRALRLPLRREHRPRLAFGRGVLARLTSEGVSVHSTTDGALVSQHPLEGPRALLSLADGALLAIGARQMSRIEPHGKSRSLPRPVLLPGTEVFADALASDRIWVFDGQREPPTLSSYSLLATAQSLLLPELEVALEAPRGGALGVTREGVWLYFVAERALRLAPGGARLSQLELPPLARPFLVLASRRVDQSLLLAEDGRLTRALVSPVFQKLGGGVLVPAPLHAAVGDEGRLLAIVGVTGAGPAFELFAFDEQLEPLGRTPLPRDEPTGREDWAQVVTRNQELAVAPRSALIAVGGPDRVLCFGAAGNLIFAIPSR
jgi:hypothetical protein